MSKNNSSNTIAKQHIIPYYVTENGVINFSLVKYFNEVFEKRGLIIDNIGMGSAYNMPVYLLGEMEKNIDKSVVVSFYQEGNRPVPIVLFDDTELRPLIRRLKDALEDEDSFNIIKQVHKEIRG